MEVAANTSAAAGTNLEINSTASAQGHRLDTDSGAFRQSRILPTERARLMVWLNRGLRRGCAGRLEVEFPTALPEDDSTHSLERHVVIRHDADNASHALAHTIAVEARGTRTTLGMIGMVYSDPTFRGRGAARLAVECAVERLRSRGASLAILWSDLDAFYARLGFHRAGIENSYRLDAAFCASLRENSRERDEARAPRDEDWPQLERLYSEKPSRQLRAKGDLRRLARAPDCETLVAIREDKPIAYASMGRGDDLTGVVHEWGGDASGLLSCLHEFARSRGEIALLEGPECEPATRPLRDAGAQRNVGTLGLVRILDAEGLFGAIAGDEAALRNMRLTRHPRHASAYTFSTPRGDTTLSHQSALSLLLGPSLPRSLQLSLEPDECTALRLRFPWPLFIWGFDSI